MIAFLSFDGVDRSHTVSQSVSVNMSLLNDPKCAGQLLLMD